MYDCVFSFIGKLFTLYFGIKFIYNIYHILRVYIFPTYPDFSKYGKWSVVTGATSGIGEEIAFQLASRGQNIISIARNKQKLEEVSKNIALRHGVLTKYLQIDFTEDESIYEKIKEFLKDHDIGVLVNNVGMAHPIGKFTEISKLPNLITNITRLNMLSALKMSQIVLPGMEQRNRGCVINVSSMSGLHVVPNFSMYAATKAFLKHFSEILSYECEDKGITVQCCCPYYIKTNMTAFLPHWKAMTLPEDYVRSLLATLGKERVTLGSIGFMLQFKFDKSTNRGRLKKENESSPLAGERLTRPFESDGTPLDIPSTGSWQYHLEKKSKNVITEVNTAYKHFTSSNSDWSQRSNAYLHTVQSSVENPDLSSMGNPLSFESYLNRKLKLASSPSTPAEDMTQLPIKTPAGEVMTSNYSEHDEYPSSGSRLDSTETLPLETSSSSPEQPHGIRQSNLHDKECTKKSERRSHQCRYCDKVFSFACHRRTHELVHTKEQPHACPTCQRRFSQLGSLNVHKRIHTRETPYPCPICNKLFRHVNSLKRHVDHIHPEAKNKHGGYQQRVQSKKDVELTKTHSNNNREVEASLNETRGRIHTPSQSFCHYPYFYCYPNNCTKNSNTLSFGNHLLQPFHFATTPITFEPSILFPFHKLLVLKAAQNRMGPVGKALASDIPSRPHVARNTTFGFMLKATTGTARNSHSNGERQTKVQQHRFLA